MTAFVCQIPKMGKIRMYTLGDPSAHKIVNMTKENRMKLYWHRFCFPYRLSISIFQGIQGPILTLQVPRRQGLWSTSVIYLSDWIFMFTSRRLRSRRRPLSWGSKIQVCLVYFERSLSSCYLFACERLTSRFSPFHPNDTLKRMAILDSRVGNFMSLCDVPKSDWVFRRSAWPRTDGLPNVRPRRSVVYNHLATAMISIRFNIEKPTTSSQGKCSVFKTWISNLCW